MHLADFQLNTILIILSLGFCPSHSFGACTFFARLDNRYLYLALAWKFTTQYLISWYIITMICALESILLHKRLNTSTIFVLKSNELKLNEPLLVLWLFNAKVVLSSVHEKIKFRDKNCSKTIDLIDYQMFW